MQVRLNCTLKSPILINFNFFFTNINVISRKKAKLFRSKSRSLDILFLLLLYAQHKSHFFLCKNSSTKIASTGALPVNNSFAGISSLIKTTMPPPNYFQSFRKRGAKPGILNWYSRNLSSSFVSEISRTSTFPVNYLTRRSNLFCKEFILKWPEKMWFKFLLRLLRKLVG